MAGKAFTLLILGALAQAHATFSIVAVDTVTKEVGSAGASCTGGVIDISAMLPGRGGINAQAALVNQNRDNALARMVAGDSPQQIIAWLQANDVGGNAATRQYGIVDLDAQGKPRSAGFTGSSNSSYANHVLGRNFAAQGNILIGQAVLDAMRDRFLATPGPLADKLMAALQGGKRPGADTRCQQRGISSLSAYLRVAKSTDAAGRYSLNLNVDNIGNREPVDSLQKLYDKTKIPSAAARAAFLEGPTAAQWFDVRGRRLGEGDYASFRERPADGVRVLRIRDARGRSRPALFYLP